MWDYITFAIATAIFWGLGLVLLPFTCFLPKGNGGCVLLSCIHHNLPIHPSADSCVVWKLAAQSCPGCDFDIGILHVAHVGRRVPLAS